MVQWVSGSRGPQGVQWGPAPGALRRAVPSSPVTYSAAQMCGAPANSTGWLDPGWQHRATISEMPPPGSRLWYRFGSDADGWSAVYSAVAPAAPGAPVKFLTFNDGEGAQVPQQRFGACSSVSQAAYAHSRPRAAAAHSHTWSRSPTQTRPRSRHDVSNPVQQPVPPLLPGRLQLVT